MPKDIFTTPLKKNFLACQKYASLEYWNFSQKKGGQKFSHLAGGALPLRYDEAPASEAAGWSLVRLGTP